MNQTLRRFTKLKFKKWKEFTKSVVYKETALDILFKVVQKHKLQAKVKTWKDEVKIQRRFNYINTFLSK